MGGEMNSGLKMSLRLLPLLLMGGLMAVGSGCMRPYGIPPYSQLVAEAPGQVASFQAPDDGTVYVDGPSRASRHIVYSGLIRRGEVVTIDPQNERLIVNGKPADATIVGGRSFYQVWYASAHNELLGY